MANEIQPAGFYELADKGDSLRKFAEVLPGVKRRVVIIYRNETNDWTVTATPPIDDLTVVKTKDGYELGAYDGSTQSQ